jgi:hypothetical protein
MDFYENWCEDAGYQPAAPDLLARGLRQLCDASTEWDGDFVWVDGPDPTSRGWSRQA